MRPRIANAQWRRYDPTPQEIQRMTEIDRQMDELAARRKDLSQIRQRITSRIRTRYMARRRTKEQQDDRAVLCG
jgi:hypothetical protein